MLVRPAVDEAFYLFQKKASVSGFRGFLPRSPLVITPASTVYYAVDYGL